MRIQDVRRAFALALTAAAVAAPAAVADEIHQTQGLRKALTVEGVREHQAAFQTHTDLNGGNRTGGSPGFEASAVYVKARAAAAGLQTADHFFDFLYNADRTPPSCGRSRPARSSTSTASTTPR